MAQLQTNWSKDKLEHSKLFNVGEILAWGYPDDLTKDTKKLSAYKGWYFDEKINYIKIQEGKEPDKNLANGQTGHYEAIVNKEYALTGFAISINGPLYNGVTHGQTFGRENYYDPNGTIGNTVFKTYTYDEYSKLFNEYYNKVMSGELTKEKQLEKVNKELEDAKAALAKADNEYNVNKNKLSEVNEKLSSARTLAERLKNELEEVDIKVNQLKDEVRIQNELLKNAQTILNQKEADFNLKNDQYKNIESSLNEANKVKTEKDIVVETKTNFRNQKQALLNDIDANLAEINKNYQAALEEKNAAQVDNDRKTQLLNQVKSILENYNNEFAVKNNELSNQTALMNTLKADFDAKLADSDKKRQELENSKSSAKTYLEKLNKAAYEFNIVSEKLKSFEVYLQKVKNDLQNKQSEYDKAVKNETDLKALYQAELINNQKAVAEYELALKQLEATKNTVLEMQKVYDEKAALKNIADKNLGKALANLKNFIDYDENKFNEDLKTAKDNLEKAKTEQEKANAKVELARKVLNEKQAKLNEANRKLKNALDKLNAYNANKNKNQAPNKVTEKNTATNNTATNVAVNDTVNNNQSLVNKKTVNKINTAKNTEAKTVNEIKENENKTTENTEKEITVTKVEEKNEVKEDVKNEVNATEEIKNTNMFVMPAIFAAIAAIMIGGFAWFFVTRR